VRAHPRTRTQACTPEKHHFVGKIFLASGISHTRTALPRCLLPVHVDEFKTDYKSARVEAEQVLYQVIENVLEKTGIKPEQVDILISSCSIYCPTPSIASMIINKFKMREDIQVRCSCAAGVVGQRRRGPARCLGMHSTHPRRHVLAGVG
jgi:3-ketoacyl-CoA synthase